jgi:hypothetical protein
MEPMVTRVHPNQALAVYAESLAAGANALVFGDASLGLAEQLLELGARSVQVWDPLPASARSAVPGAPAPVVVRSYSAFEPTTRGAALAIVPDLGLFDDPALLVARVRDAVGAEGVALIAAENAEAPESGSPRTFDYYELFDLVAGDFASVRMVAELPFEGVAFVTLGESDDAPAVSVDPTLADGERAPLAFIAVASQSETDLDPYAIVELPPSEEADEEEADEEEADEELELEEIVAPGPSAEEEAERLRILESLESRVRAEVDRAAELEATLALREREMTQLSAHAEGVAERARAAAAAMEPMAARLDRAELRAAEMQDQLARAGDFHAAEHARFEDALRERAQALREVEAELARRERMVRELVGALEEAAAPVVAASPAEAKPSTFEPTADAIAEANEAASTATARAAAATEAATEATAENARLRDQLDALALELARREGEAQATLWTVSELERRLALTNAGTEPDALRLADAAPPAAPAMAPPVTAGREDGDIHAALSAAQDQLDALRQALAQEHEARVKAESGEELARARAEIRRLESLITS